MKKADGFSTISHINKSARQDFQALQIFSSYLIFIFFLFEVVHLVVFRNKVKINFLKLAPMGKFLQIFQNVEATPPKLSLRKCSLPCTQSFWCGKRPNFLPTLKPTWEKQNWLGLFEFNVPRTLRILSCLHAYQEPPTLFNNL